MLIVPQLFDWGAMLDFYKLTEFLFQWHNGHIWDPLHIVTSQFVLEL